MKKNRFLWLSRTMIIRLLIWSLFYFQICFAGVNGNGNVLANEGSNDDCYSAMPDAEKSSPNSSLYIFWDHIVISSTRLSSRCIVLKEVPYTGYYKVKVTALYSLVETQYQNKEQYRLCVQLPDTLVRGAIIPDQNSEKTTGVKVTGPKSPKYDYYEIDHGLIYFVKGDNKIWFEAGEQYGLGPKDTHSVDFEVITLIHQTPSMVAEPPFTAGNSNVVKYRPVFSDVYYQEVVCFDRSMPSLHKPQVRALRKAVPDSIKSAVFNGLEDGHTYGYYIETYLTPDQVIYSDTTFSTQDAAPPEQVVIDPMSSIANRRAFLYWQGVLDKGSGVKEYHVIRIQKSQGIIEETTVAVIPEREGCEGACQYEFIDDIPDPNQSYQYRIDAVDQVGNKRIGKVSELVVGIPAPQVRIVNGTIADHFYKGSSITLEADISKLKLPELHLVKFQIARDQSKFLDDRWRPGVFFFESEWLPITSKSESPKFTCDLTNNGRSSLAFVDGHRYYIRAQYKDLQENYSEWSSPDTLWIVPDCFAPSDVQWLTVDAVKNETNTEGWMALHWGAAQDATSGVKEYVVYRRIDDLETIFKEIARTIETLFNDSFADIGYNGNVTYYVLAADRVNNITSDKTALRAGGRCQLGPQISISHKAYVNGKYYTTESVENLTVDLKNFKVDGSIATIMMEYNGIEYLWPDPVNDGLNIYPINIPKNDSLKVRVKVVFKNKAESLWSNLLTIVQVPELPKSAGQSRKLLNAYNFPNPFNPTTQITFDLENDAEITVEVYNIQGKKIKHLFSGSKPGGRVNLLWDGTNDEGTAVASGQYFYYISVQTHNHPRQTIVNSMILLK